MPTKKRVTVQKTRTRPESVTLDSVRDLLRALRSSRETIKDLDSQNKKIQPEIIAVMRDLDKNNHGVIVDDDTAGFVQQNDPSQFWDQEQLIEWLRKEGLWDDCSVRVFDQARFEDLVSKGVIPAHKVKKFKVTGDMPTPYVRFGKPKKESL